MKKICIAGVIRILLSIASFILVLDYYGKKWAGLFLLIFFISEAFAYMLKRWASNIIAPPKG